MILDPKLTAAVHRRDCGLYGPCDCDAHRIGFVRRLLRVVFGR